MTISGRMQRRFFRVNGSCPALERGVKVGGVLLLLAGMAAMPMRGGALPGLLYGTGFESGGERPFILGDLHGQNQWEVIEGSAVVQSSTRARGWQAVMAGSGIFQLNAANAQPVLWVDGFFRDGGSAGQPMLPGYAASSVLVFSAAKGLLALDGDGNGNGVFIQVRPVLFSGEWVRVSLREDFTAGRYEVWIDGVLSRAGLGFKDNTIRALSVVRRHCDAASFLDDVSISTAGLDMDTDGDGVNDLDEIKFYASDPLRPDSDADGMSDGEEVFAGTDPSSAASVFAVKIGRNEQGQPRVQVPSVTGRQYLLQRRATLASQDEWKEVPGWGPVTGDGANKEFVETGSGTNWFYRGVVIKPK